MFTPEVENLHQSTSNFEMDLEPKQKLAIPCLHCPLTLQNLNFDVFERRVCSGTFSRNDPLITGQLRDC